jgi:Uma2 family endonuclease
MYYGIISRAREYERSSKFVHYRSIPGLQDYLLVDPEAVSVEHFHRLKRDEWPEQYVITRTLTSSNQTEIFQLALRLHDCENIHAELLTEAAQTGQA